MWRTGKKCSHFGRWKANEQKVKDLEEKERKKSS
jgi:hypothetical protein